MAGNIASSWHAVKINRIAMLWLYPQLRELPPEAWESVLHKARDTDFVTAEWVGIIGGVAFIAWLLGLESSVSATQPPFVAHLLRFVLALPLLVVIVGPLYLRRTRRGLERELARGEGHTVDAKAWLDRKEA